jgi:hypothetical protein
MAVEAAEVVEAVEAEAAEVTVAVEAVVTVAVEAVVTTEGTEAAATEAVGKHTQPKRRGGGSLWEVVSMRQLRFIHQLVRTTQDIIGREADVGKEAEIGAIAIGKASW